MNKPDTQKETDTKLKIIIKDDGHSYLIYDSKEYIIGNRNDVEFGSGEIPRIIMDQIPDNVQFKIMYRDVIIFSPNKYTDNGTACIAIPDDAWGMGMVTTFKEFLIENDLFGGAHDKDLSGIPFIGMKIQGEVLDTIIECAKKIIDDFLSQYNTLRQTQE